MGRDGLGIVRAMMPFRQISAWLLAALGPAAAMAQTMPDVPIEQKPPQAVTLPKWEAGLAVVTLSGPAYPASDTRRHRLALAPIVIYRGERLRVDDQGVRGRLIDTGRFELDVSGAAGFNARSSSARDGMPKLDYTFELGPQALYRVPLGEGRQLSAHLKARAVFSSNFKNIDARGFVVEPELRYRWGGWPTDSSRMQVSAQATWASEALHDYFYAVSPAYATPTRPAYDARAGYFGSALRVGWMQRLGPQTSISVGVSLNHHGGAANRRSPLFERNTTVTGVVALVWLPWRSGETGSP